VATRPLSVTPSLLQTLVNTTSSLPLQRFDVTSASAYPGSSSDSFTRTDVPHLNSKMIRRLLTARESIFKYGIYLPRNDRDADASPESLRWNSGRQLEWLRLKKVEAFEYDWTFPTTYLRTLVSYSTSTNTSFPASTAFAWSLMVRVKQGINTYDETYSPTVRPESIRLFHVYAVQMGWDIRQYDVPQAFLQSPVDHDIFVHPPRTNVEFPGQLLKLRLALYGAKQSSALFFKLLNGVLLSLGFASSTLDICLYQRHDFLLIVHVYDMRCADTLDALQAIHEALFTRFKITTGDGNRFLGMDTHYDLTAGILTMGMDTYIQSTMERFAHFDLTLGIPYRETVGCLLWIVLCIVGPELMRVKDLDRRSNAPTPADYQDALKVLKRIFKRCSSVIMFKRGYAGRELVPATTRPEPPVSSLALAAALGADLPLLTDDPPSSSNTQSDVFRSFDFMQTQLEIPEIVLPTTSRLTVGELKESISGYTIFVNGTPLMWGSMRQINGADSTCAAEFVAASVCCKQLLRLENMFRFFWLHLSQAVSCLLFTPTPRRAKPSP
jgi:hypothetical protein